MQQNFTSEERELIRLVRAFKKKVEALKQVNKTEEDYTQILETGEKLVEQIHVHATNRDMVAKEREKLKGLIRENAICPKCNKNANLKFIGTDKSPEGWKSNKYRCKKCNIEFVWNAPNNPWDMIPYVEKFIKGLEEKLEKESPDEASKEATVAEIDQMKSNLEKLKPVVNAADDNLADVEAREKEMADMIHKFKKYLMIEKIRLDD